jgi:hypothetical protein
MNDATPRIGRIKRFRLGVMTADGDDFRPVMNLQASRDGGLMMWPTPIPTSETWEISTVKIPAGGFTGLPALPPPEEIVTVDQSPKVHYHRSGYVSANLSHQSERRSFDGVAIQDLRGEQLFSALFSLPLSMPYDPHWLDRRGDVFTRSYSRTDSTLRVSGFIYELSQVERLIRGMQPEGEAWGIVAGTRDELIVNFSGHGLEAVLVLRLDWTDEEPLVPGAPQALLAAFNTAKVYKTTLCEAVVVLSPNDAVKRIHITERANRPFRPFWIPRPASSLEHRFHERRPTK